MIEVKEKKLCCGCAACMNICPVRCISMRQDEEGFFYPEIDGKKCVNCGKCESACPFRNHKPVENDPKTYAAKSRSQDIRLDSSSGGVFHSLAKLVLQRGGVVIGVSFSENFHIVEHIVINQIEDISKVRKSKYIQAEPSMIYSQAKKHLDEGRYVLFSGTPCQVNAFRLFLGKDYPNLLCVDVLCHGVPSRKLWEKYLEVIICKIGLLRDVNFRCKTFGWKDFGLEKSIAGGKTYYSSKEWDPYMQMFLRNYSLRPSCYECKAKAVKLSDITLGDFWGIEKVIDQFDDGMGCSLVLARSSKGEKIITELENELLLKEVDYEASISNNYVEYKSVPLPIERGSFYKDMNVLSFAQLSKKYTPVKTMSRIKRIIRSLKRGGEIKSSEYGILFISKNKNYKIGKYFLNRHSSERLTNRWE